MTSLPITNRCPMSPSQPSPVGASAYAVSGPTRSGCGLRGTRPLSPSQEVQRSMASVDKCGGRQRSRVGRRIDTVSRFRFVLYRGASILPAESLPPVQYYGGQNAIQLKSILYIAGWLLSSGDSKPLVPRCVRGCKFRIISIAGGSVNSSWDPYG